MIRACAAPLVLALCLLACSSAKKKAYENLAKEANPILEQIKPVIARLLAVDPADHQAVISVCMSADDPLWELRHVRFDDELVDTLPTTDRVSTLAAEFLDRRKVICRDYAAHRIEPCSDWCRGKWMSLVDSVEVVRRAAQGEGVRIVSLKPGE